MSSCRWVFIEDWYILPYLFISSRIRTQVDDSQANHSAHLLEKFSSVCVAMILANFDFNSIKFGPPIKCDVHIPKFKIESTHELNDPLKGLGLTDMFDEEKADFSGELSLAVLRRIYHYGRWMFIYRNNFFIAQMANSTA